MLNHSLFSNDNLGTYQEEPDSALVYAGVTERATRPGDIVSLAGTWSQAEMWFSYINADNDHGFLQRLLHPSALQNNGPDSGKLPYSLTQKNN